MRLALSRQCGLLITQPRQLLDLRRTLVGRLLRLHLPVVQPFDLARPVGGGLVCCGLGLAHCVKVCLKVFQRRVGHVKCCQLHVQPLLKQFGLVALGVEPQQRHWPQGLLVKLSSHHIEANALKLVHRLPSGRAPRRQGFARSTQQHSVKLDERLVRQAVQQRGLLARHVKHQNIDATGPSRDLQRGQHVGQRPRIDCSRFDQPQTRVKRVQHARLKRAVQPPQVVAAPFQRATGHTHRVCKHLGPGALGCRAQQFCSSICIAFQQDHTGWFQGGVALQHGAASRTDVHHRSQRLFSKSGQIFEQDCHVGSVAVSALGCSVAWRVALATLCQRWPVIRLSIPLQGCDGVTGSTSFVSDAAA